MKAVEQQKAAKQFAEDWLKVPSSVLTICCSEYK